MLMLQTQGRLTAQELAAELEVSERTIYRDINALSSAGVPVYTERGPGGGCSLLESFRTNLTGLTRDEVSALFMLSIPTPLVDLGLDRDLKAALRKLSAALPDIFRHEGARAQDRIHLDPSTWLQHEQYTPRLNTIQSGLADNFKIKLTYQLAFGAQIEHIVEPLGLVAKENKWYFIFSRGGVISVVPLSDILDVQLLKEKFSLPAEFNLVKFWKSWCSKREGIRPQYLVHVRIKSELLEMLKLFRAPVLLVAQEGGQVDHDGWQEMKFQFKTFEGARKQLLSFGGAVEVISPLSLRKSVQDFSQQVVNLYKP
jgi:predicted DNA-binding transcriptional regulator YafY